MTVYFSELRIRNFRSCIDTKLHVASYTALIGRNNSGKSNCLSALQWLVRRETLTVDDFNNPEEGIEVIGKLVGVRDADLDTLEATHRRKIAKYVAREELTIRRTQNAPGVVGALTVLDPETGDWEPNPAGIDNAVKALFPDPIRIGAMENAEEDASKAKTTTTIGKLLASMLDSIRQTHEEELTPFIEQISSRLSASGANRFEELGRIDESINTKISDLFPGMSIKLDFPIPAFQDLIKTGTVRVYEGDQKGRPFGFYGHGAQRAIQMAMVRHLADLKRSDVGVGGAALLLVDEPVLFMHPFAVEQVREALRTLSKAGYQVVFSTHCAQMVLAADAKNALLMTKDSVEGTKARPRLDSLIEQLVPDANHQLMHLFSLTNSSQVLFSEKVVLTEGKTELRLLPSIYSQIANRSLGQGAIALVAQGGVANTKKSMAILDALGLPACAIVDLDFAFQHGVSHGFLEENDVDLQACKEVLVRLASEGMIRINQLGLPEKKGAPCSASEAYELLASQDESQAPVASLVAKFREQRVWLWSKGAIEPHLGIDDKDESEWLKFQMRCQQEGIEAVCADADGIRRLVAWIDQPEHCG
jgi:energy-coupling factor transporter ATP-binding protein EcfA2